MSEHDTGTGPDLARLNTSAVEPEIRRIATVLLPVFYDQSKNIAHRARTRLEGSYTLQTAALVQS